MTRVILDTHVVHWWSADRKRLSADATEAIERADELAVAAITWWELAWLATHGRLGTARPVRAWLIGLAGQLRTIPIAPAIASTAAGLPRAFPGDPADRLIYATAIETGWALITRDESLRAYAHPTPVTIW